MSARQPNRFAEDASHTLREIAPNDANLRYSDVAHVDLTPQRARFDRIVAAEGGLQWDAPGARIRFVTDALKVLARFSYNGLHTKGDVNNGVGAFLIDGKMAGTWGQGDAKSGDVTATLQAQSKAVSHLYEIVMPCGQSADFQGLTTEGGTVLKAAPARSKTRYVAYGDSITQGFWTSDPTQNYPFLIGEKNGWEVINMGFGGRATTSKDAEIVASLKGDVITMLIGYNDQFSRKPEEYGAELQKTLTELRAAQPKTPIYVVTLLWSTNPYPTKYGLPTEEFRKAARTAFAAVQDTNFHLVEGETLIPGEAKYFADGIHPNNEGFALLAKNLAPQLQAP